MSGVFHYFWHKIHLKDNDSRNSHSSIVRKDQLYVFGGSGENTGVLSSLPLDITIPRHTRHSFKTLGENIPSRMSHSMVAYDKKLIVFGGKDCKTGEALNDLMYYSFDKKPEWKVLETKNPPPPRYGHTAVVHNKTMIVFGGVDDHKTTELGALDPKALLMSMSLALMASSNHLKKFTLDVFDDVWVLDLNTLTWTQQTCSGPKPQARGLHSACVFDESEYLAANPGKGRTALPAFMVIYGGLCQASKLADIHYLDLKKYAWVNLGGLAKKSTVPSGTPPPLCGHSAVYSPVSNSMLVYGGRALNSSSNSVWKYSFFSYAWEEAEVEEEEERNKNSDEYLDGGEEIKEGADEPEQTLLPPARYLHSAAAQLLTNTTYFAPYHNKLRATPALDADLQNATTKKKKKKKKDGDAPSLPAALEQSTHLSLTKLSPLSPSLDHAVYGDIDAATAAVNALVNAVTGDADAAAAAVPAPPPVVEGSKAAARVPPPPAPVTVSKPAPPASVSVAVVPGGADGKDGKGGGVVSMGKAEGTYLRSLFRMICSGGIDEEGNILKDVWVLEEVEEADVLTSVSRSKLLPSFMKEIINSLLNQQWLNEEGLFRISGMKESIDDVYDKSKKLKGDKRPKLETLNPHVVSGLFKKLLREDYQPIITEEMQTLFIASLYCVSVCDALRVCVQCLSEDTKDIIFPALFLLNKYSLHYRRTKMAVKNISIVFTPILFATFQKKDDFLAVASRMDPTNPMFYVIEALIKFCDLIAAPVNDALPCIYTGVGFAEYDYNGADGGVGAGEEEPLRFFVNDVCFFYIFDYPTSGWALGEINGTVGLIPMNYFTIQVSLKAHSMAQRSTISTFSTFTYTLSSKEYSEHLRRVWNDSTCQRFLKQSSLLVKVAPSAPQTPPSFNSALPPFLALLHNSAAPMAVVPPPARGSIATSAAVSSNTNLSASGLFSAASTTTRASVSMAASSRAALNASIANANSIGGGGGGGGGGSASPPSPPASSSSSSLQRAPPAPPPPSLPTGGGKTSLSASVASIGKTGPTPEAPKKPQAPPAQQVSSTPSSESVDSAILQHPFVQDLMKKLSDLTKKERDSHKRNKRLAKERDALKADNENLTNRINSLISIAQTQVPTASGEEGSGAEGGSSGSGSDGDKAGAEAGSESGSKAGAAGTGAAGAGAQAGAGAGAGAAGTGAGAGAAGTGAGAGAGAGTGAGAGAGTGAGTGAGAGAGAGPVAKAKRFAPPTPPKGTVASPFIKSPFPALRPPTILPTTFSTTMGRLTHSENSSSSSTDASADSSSPPLPPPPPP